MAVEKKTKPMKLPTNILGVLEDFWADEYESDYGRYFGSEDN